MGEKHKGNLKEATTTQVQHMRTKLSNLWERCCSSFFSTRSFRIIVTSIIGGLLILIGGHLIFEYRIREVPDWSNHGPGILIASDKPLCGVEIFVFTKDDGTTKLIFQNKEADKIISKYSSQYSGTDGEETQSESDKNNGENQEEQVESATAPQEEGFHLWVYLDSLEDAPINWRIPEQEGDVKNHELLLSISDNYSKFFAIETSKSNGSDIMTAFEITYNTGHESMVEIDISEDPQHIAFCGNGIYKPRLPFVFSWLGYEHGSENGDLYDNLIGRSHYISDADFMRLSINDYEMYSPIFKVMASYTSLSLVNQHDLEPVWISPEPEYGYPLISWTQYLVSSPTIQFRDKAWETNAKRNNLLGGILVGLGLNIMLIVIPTLTYLYPIKKKR